MFYIIEAINSTTYRDQDFHKGNTREIGLTK